MLTMSSPGFMSSTLIKVLLVFLELVHSRLMPGAVDLSCAAAWRQHWTKGWTWSGVSTPHAWLSEPMFASQPSRTTMPCVPAAFRLVPIWRQEASNAPAAHCANWPWVSVVSSGRLTTDSGASLALPRQKLPPVKETILVKPWSGGTKVTTASSARPRSWARQGKPPPTEPERQARPERTGVLTSARAAVVVRAARSRPVVAQARCLVQVLPIGRTEVFDEHCCIVISRRSCCSSQRRDHHG